MNPRGNMSSRIVLFIAFLLGVAIAGCGTSNTPPAVTAESQAVETKPGAAPAKPEVSQPAESKPASAETGSAAAAPSEAQGAVTVAAAEPIAPALVSDPPAGPEKSQTPPKATTPLRYRFEAGKKYQYMISSKVEVGDTTLDITGSTFVTASPASPPAANEAEKPTATAFVVHADGYLITCAHVVQDAETLEVALAGKSYPAKVVGVEEQTDLALLKIEAGSLRPLPLANSEAVEVGVEVRALGYPLSSLLGESLKVTRGSISGIDQREGHKVFQIDATVNPGNSGGPLLNSQGQVVGVVDSKLLAAAVSNVGFAVPINYAKRLLGEHDLAGVTSKGNDPLSAPELIKQASASLALVTVTGEKPGSLFKLALTGSMSSSETSTGSSRPAYPLRPPGSGSSMFGFMKKVELIVDEFGNVAEMTNAGELPGMLGGSFLMFLEAFPRDGRTTWEVRKPLVIQERTEQPDHLPALLRYNSPYLNPRPKPVENGKKHLAVEKIVYTRGAVEGDVVTITRQYELKTEASGDEPPYMHMTGTGTIQFDVKAGLPKNLDYKGTAAVSIKNVTLRIPIKVRCYLVDPAKLPKTATVGSNRIPSANDSSDGSGVLRSFGEMGWGVASLAISPNGKLLVAGTMDALLVFDVEKGEKIQELKELRDLHMLSACAFTPDGTKLVTGGSSGQIQVWEIDKDELKPLERFKGHSTEIKAISISGDSRFALAAGGKSALYWEIASGKEQAIITGFRGRVEAVQLTPTRALATDGESLIEHDIATNQIVQTRKLGSLGATAVAISPQGTLVAAGMAYDVRLWETATGKELPKLPESDIQWSVVFSADGQRLISGGSGKFSVWDANSRKPIYRGNTGSIGYVKSIAVSADGNHVAAFPDSAGETLKLYRLPTK